MSLVELLCMLGLGAVLGYMGGLFGIGGGIIAIPALVLALGMEQSMAQGTALVMMVPNLAMAWWRYSQRQPMAWKTALQMGVVACITTAVVAHFATQLNAATMRTVFSVFLVLVALRMLIPVRPQAAPVAPRRVLPLRWVPGVGVAGGASMGLLGVGGGLVATPMITAWFGLPQTVAQSLSLSLVAPSSVIALLTYAQAGRVDWKVGGALAVGGLFTVSAGVALAHRLPERQMRLAFGAMLLLTAGWLLLKPLLLR